MNPESMLKGRMAESLVEELLRQSGNKVYRFGYEAILQNLTQIESNLEGHNEVTERIRAIPDFLIIDKEGKPVFIEVKFRWHPEWHENDLSKLERISKFWQAKIIFVNCSQKPYFMISEPPYIDEAKKLLAISLEEARDFNIKREVIEEFEKLVEKYLKSTLHNPQ